MEIGRAARAKGSQGKEKLRKAYANLLNSTSRVVGQAKRFAQEILDGTKCATGGSAQAALECCKGELEQMMPRVRQVIAQTKARIFHGETRTEGKIVSLFEPSTEIIRKGRQAQRIWQARQAAGGGKPDRDRVRGLRATSQRRHAADPSHRNA
jgi:IS5 family transposase